MSLSSNEKESYIKINLLATSIENRGKYKTYEHITGNLIAVACKIALKYYGENACVTLEPKSVLKQHYIDKYGMFEVAYKIFLEDIALIRLVNKYDYENE